MSNRNIDDIIEFAAWGFGFLSLVNRKLKNDTGQSLGSILGSSAKQKALRKKNTRFSQSTAVNPAFYKTAKKQAKKLKRIPVKVTELSPKSTKDRVKYIKNRIIKDSRSPKIREIASKILARKCGDDWCVKEKDYIGEINAVYSALRSQVRYTRDPLDRDLNVSAERTISQYKIGDCDDYTIVGGAILRHVGYPLKIRVIQTNGNDDFNHVYLTVGVPPSNPDKWIPVDASVGAGIGFQAPPQIVIKYADYEV